MKKLFLISSVLICLFLVPIANAFALEPVLYFSDITSGPKTGLGDGKGSGAIVTIWGANLGSIQGTSKVYVGGVPASYVYYWGNADTTGASGPADLYTYHKMQTISFSVPPTAADGANTISVTVNGAQTNTLPFTVRAGNIYFVKTTGVDSTTAGSWGSPWKTLSYVGGGAGGKVTAGDVIYVADNVLEPSGLPIKYMKGTPQTPYSIIAYPGAKVVIQGSFGIGNHNRSSAYWNFSKLTIKTQGSGIGTLKGMRAVANEITNYPGGCATGQSGAISGGNSVNSPEDSTGGVRALGNYIHDFGCDTTSKLHHVFYISNRSGFAVESFELGWNYLTDNKAHHGLHVYDEGACGDFTGVMRMHDNVVKNQVGVGVGVSSSGTDPCFTMPVEIYNNLFINVGLEIPSCSGHNDAVNFNKITTRSHIKLYNNTIYGYGITGNGAAIAVQGGAGTGWDFGGTWEMKNNIIVDTKDVPYVWTSNGKAADVSSNNLWYNGGDGNPAAPPSWDAGALTSSPLFADPAKGYFNLQIGSPAMGTGTDTSPVVTRDFRGLPRGLGKSYSIGAFEYIKSSLPSAPSALTVQ